MPHAVSPQRGSSPDDTIVDAAPSASDVDQDAASHDSDHSRQDTAEAASSSSDDVRTQDPTRLDDIFDGEEDEEFSDSLNVPLQPSHTAKFSDPEVMRAFYQRLFPFRYLFQWLNHSTSPTNDFAHREFAFTLPGDIYLRYQSFNTADFLRKQCIAQTPSRFEIGPVYSTNPRDRKTLRRAAAFRPISKELCFDIDMTDYDEIRTCCTGASICHRCWSFIRMAIKVIDLALRDDFGFRHILWVYSGRRGAHAWVCDKRARELDDSKRKAIAGYLELVKGGDASSRKVNAERPLHPHIERSLQSLKKNFQYDVLHDQDPWALPEKSERLLKLLPDRELNQALLKKWGAAPSRSSANKWSDITALASAGTGSASLDTKKLKETMEDIVLEYTYPRLDAEVSKHLNHLLKSPFCVHPGTGRVCVPIDPKSVDEFDPFEVPTVTELLGQIDGWQAPEGIEGDGKVKKLQDWEKTRLKPYVEFFRGFVSTLLGEEQGSKRRRNDTNDEMEF